MFVKIIKKVVLFLRIFIAFQKYLYVSAQLNLNRFEADTRPSDSTASEEELYSIKKKCGDDAIQITKRNSMSKSKLLLFQCWKKIKRVNPKLFDVLVDFFFTSAERQSMYVKIALR